MEDSQNPIPEMESFQYCSTQCMILNTDLIPNFIEGKESPKIPIKESISKYFQYLMNAEKIKKQSEIIKRLGTQFNLMKSKKFTL